MTPRLLTGCEKWPNFHRGAFRPPSGGGSLRRRPPAPSASRRFEPREAAALFALERCARVCTHALRVLWRCARFPPLFPWARLFEHRPRALIGSCYLREEKGCSSRSLCVCMKKNNRRNRELRQPSFRVRRRIKRWAVCRGWRKEAVEVTPSASSVRFSNRHSSTLCQDCLWIWWLIYIWKILTINWP